MPRINLSELSEMDAGDRNAILESVVTESTTEGFGRAAVLARLRMYERRYEMSSKELIKRLRSGEQAETADVSKWLFCLSTLPPRVG